METKKTGKMSDKELNESSLGEVEGKIDKMNKLKELRAKLKTLKDLQKELNEQEK